MRVTEGKASPNDGQTPADFLPKTKNCRRLSVVSESLKEKVSPLTMMCTYPTTARHRQIFDQRQKIAEVWQWSVRRGD